MNIYIISEQPQKTEAVNLYQSRIITEEEMLSRYKHIGYKSELSLHLVSIDGSDGVYNYEVHNIRDILSQISPDGWWHVKRTTHTHNDNGINVLLFGDDAPAESETEEHLYINAIKI